MKELECSIGKRFKGFSLDLSFTMGEGCLAILGASGSGKTMTLRSIAGIETPDRGRVAFGERVFFDSAARIDLPPQQRRVGYLFQSYALFPNMTVEENITAGLGRLPAAQKREIAARQVERFRLGGLESRRPAQLSGGQQQRVALARIFACDPELLLLDEPFSALDSYLREELLLELERTLAAYRGTAILVTHSREEAYRLSQRVLVLDGGRRSALGETRSVFRDPGTVQAARLTGCRNIAPARKAGEELVEVPRWGLTLRTGRGVPEDLTHIGIHAHRLHPAGEGEGNRIPVNHPSALEGPVRWEVLFCPMGGDAPLWWSPGEEPKALPPELAVFPEDILFLRG